MGENTTPTTEAYDSDTQDGLKSFLLKHLDLVKWADRMLQDGVIPATQVLADLEATLGSLQALEAHLNQRIRSFKADLNPPKDFGPAQVPLGPAGVIQAEQPKEVPPQTMVSEHVRIGADQVREAVKTAEAEKPVEQVEAPAPAEEELSIEVSNLNCKLTFSKGFANLLKNK